MAGKKSGFTQKTVKEYVDLLYMTPNMVLAKDIAELLRENKDLKVELWEEMNVIELELSNQNSVDIEPLEPSFKDPSDASFLKNRNINTIFAINTTTSDLNLLIPYFEQIVEKFEGFVCTDSDDFNPVYAGTTKK